MACYASMVVGNIDLLLFILMYIDSQYENFYVFCKAAGIDAIKDLQRFKFDYSLVMLTSFV